MPRKFILVTIIMLVVSLTIGYIAIQPENFRGSDGTKPAETVEKSAGKAGNSQENNEDNVSKSSVETGVTVGKRLPEFSLGTLRGQEIKVIAGGQPLVLNFWATWCPPCRQEIPELEKFSRQYKGKITFYAVNIQESEGKITEFMTQNQYSLPVLADKDGAVAKSFRINSIPTTLVVDKQGIIRYRKTGPVTVSELEGVLNGL